MAAIPTAIPVKPNSAASSAIIRNVTIQRIIFLSFSKAFLLNELIFPLKIQCHQVTTLIIFIVSVNKREV